MLFFLRAEANNAARGRPGKMSRAWLAIGFFVPVYGAVHRWVVAKQTWEGTVDVQQPTDKAVMPKSLQWWGAWAFAMVAFMYIVAIMGFMLFNSARAFMPAVGRDSVLTIERAKGMSAELIQAWAACLATGVPDGTVLPENKQPTATATQPTNTNVNSGANFSFTAAANGSARSHGPRVRGADFTLFALLCRDNGARFSWLDAPTEEPAPLSVSAFVEQRRRAAAERLSVLSDGADGSGGGLSCTGAGVDPTVAASGFQTASASIPRSRQRHRISAPCSTPPAAARWFCSVRPKADRRASSSPPNIPRASPG